MLSVGVVDGGFGPSAVDKTVPIAVVVVDGATAIAEDDIVPDDEIPLMRILP